MDPGCTYCKTDGPHEAKCSADVHENIHLAHGIHDDSCCLCLSSLVQPLEIVAACAGNGSLKLVMGRVGEDLGKPSNRQVDEHSTGDGQTEGDTTKLS